jgi:hypothetical protein
MIGNIVEALTAQVNERKLKDQEIWSQGTWRKQLRGCGVKSKGQRKEYLEKGF